MQLPIFEKYIDELIEKSTLDVPAWNIEKAREGKAAGWNYIDGCMILALLEIYSTTGEKKYYEFADAFIDHRVQEDGTITKYSVEEYNIDNVNAGKTLFALYALNGKEKYRKAIDLMELKTGDYVVHEQHGIGRFVEMRQRTIGKGENQTTREYLVIEYAPSKRGAPADKLFIPTDQLDQVSKYIGAETPKLNKLGGSDWAATKALSLIHI